MGYYYDEDPDYDYDDLREDRMEFADPGGRSSLRAAGPNNPRNRPCPTCEHPNRLTPLDVQLGYQCDRCADALERGGEIDYYEDDYDDDYEEED